MRVDATGRPEYAGRQPDHYACSETAMQACNHQFPPAFRSNAEHSGLLKLPVHIRQRMWELLFEQYMVGTLRVASACNRGDPQAITRTTQVQMRDAKQSSRMLSRRFQCAARSIWTCSWSPSVALPGYSTPLSSTELVYARDADYEERWLRESSRAIHKATHEDVLVVWIEDST